MGGNADVVPGIENNFSEGADHTVENLVFAFAVMTGKCLVPGFFCRIDDLFRQFGQSRMSFPIREPSAKPKFPSLRLGIISILGVGFICPAAISAVCSARLSGEA